MSRWLVTHGESQFSAQDLAELKQMASDGRVQPADLIQPPGASDWLYALELPELKNCFASGMADEDDDTSFERKKLIPRPVVVILLLGVTGVGLAMLKLKGVMVQSLDHGLDSDEAMLSDDVKLHSEPDEDSKVIGSLDEGDVVEFVLRQNNIDPKVGDWWLVEADGKKWIPANAAPSSFGFDENARVEDMALYYPEHHIRLTSSVEQGYSWVKLKDKLYGNDADGYVRIKDIAITNESNYALTDVIISIDVLDSKGKVDSRELIELKEPFLPMPHHCPLARCTQYSTSMHLTGTSRMRTMMNGKQNTKTDQSDPGSSLPQGFVERRDRRMPPSSTHLQRERTHGENRLRSLQRLSCSNPKTSMNPMNSTRVERSGNTAWMSKWTWAKKTTQTSKSESTSPRRSGL